MLGGFGGVLGWFRLFVGLDGCARILFGGFWIVIGTVIMRWLITEESLGLLLQLGLDR